MTKQELINRLHRVQGQLGGIEKMIERDAACPDVTLQIKAVTKAILKIGEHVIYSDLDKCLSSSQIVDTNSKLKLLIKDIFSLKND